MLENNKESKLRDFYDYHISRFVEPASEFLYMLLSFVFAFAFLVVAGLLVSNEAYVFKGRRFEEFFVIVQGGLILYALPSLLRINLRHFLNKASIKNSIKLRKSDVKKIVISFSAYISIKMFLVFIGHGYEYLLETMNNLMGLF